MKKQIEVVLTTSWAANKTMMYLYTEIESGVRHELTDAQVQEQIKRIPQEGTTYLKEVIEVEVPEEVKPEPKKQPKLSKTMQAEVDKMHKADWYYKHDGSSCEWFANENGVRRIGYEGIGIVEGGYVYNQMSSNTLKALEKRGLIEIAYDGKQSFDAVKVVGMGLPKRLEKALMVKVLRTNLNRPEQGAAEFTAYATSEDAVNHLIAEFEGHGNHFSATAEIVGEVELTVWDFFKNK